MRGAVPFVDKHSTKGTALFCWLINRYHRVRQGYHRYGSLYHRPLQVYHRYESPYHQNTIHTDGICV